jgi:hypothetical protein
MPYADHVTNSARLSSVAKNSQGWRMEDQRSPSTISVLDLPSSSHLLITRPADHWANTDDTEEKLVDGNLVRCSDLPKRA